MCLECEREFDIGRAKKEEEDKEEEEEEEGEEEEGETEEGLGWLPCSFHPDSPFEKKWLQTNGPTDGPTDGQTDQRTDKASYRDAWTHLKTTFFMVRGQVMFCIITAIVFLSFLCRFHSKSAI